MKNRESVKLFLASLAAIACGLLVGFIIIMIANPSQGVRAFSIMLQGGFYRGLRSTGQVLYFAVPIMMTGLSVAFAFKCGNFNIGATGQFTVGAFTSIFLANTLYGVIPDSVLWIVALLGAGIAGALWALIPGILKAYKNVNIVISGIMFNYIGMLLVIEGVKAFIYDQAGARSQTALVAIPKMGLNKIFPGSDINAGTIIAIVVCIVAWYILNKTTFGYELKACGYNQNATQYAGMNDKNLAIFSLLCAGFFAGLGGGLTYIAGTGKAISTAEVLMVEGFNGIPVALLGMNSPLGCIASALFVSYINLGGNYMQAVNIPVEVIDVMVAVIIYFSSFTLLVKGFIDSYNKRKEKGLLPSDGGSE